MSQLNLNLTPEFRRDLKRYMKEKGITQKSEAIRKAVHEATERLHSQKKICGFNELRGLGLKAPLNPSPRFKSEDDLWEKS